MPWPMQKRETESESHFSRGRKMPEVSGLSWIPVFCPNPKERSAVSRFFAPIITETFAVPMLLDCLMISVTGTLPTLCVSCRSRPAYFHTPCSQSTMEFGVTNPRSMA